jgi:hypothetical protein
MKKSVFAPMMALAMALASLSLFSAHTLQAQDTGQISIKDPAEFNSYQNAITQTDPKAKASALESFLTNYPQSVVKKLALDQLVDTYFQSLNDPDHALSAATRLLQVDPNNLKAILYSVVIKKGQCGKTSDAQTCDDAAAMATKGLALAKPADTADADWKKLTGAAFPLFHSAIALDDAIAKKDFKAAENEYKAELMLYSDDQSKTSGLSDTLFLAQAYSAPGAGQDLEQASWFYARVWDFAPPAYKAQIEPKLEYYYKKYHGGLDGLDGVKSAAAATTFPPGTFKIALAKTPAERIHDMLNDPTIKLPSLALSDKETILALGSKDDAEKIWAVMKDQQTPVPGTVMDAPVTGLKVGVTIAAKTTDFMVSLKTPMACKDVPEAAASLSQKKDFILTNGVKDDTDKIDAISPDNKKPVTKLAVDGTISVIKVAVTQDAKDAKTPDFIVNMKEPAACKVVPPVGADFKLQPDTELDGTYDTYTQIPATATVAQSAEIVLREGFVQEEKKKTAPAAHKPAAAHRAAAH